METLSRRERERQTRKEEILTAAESVFGQRGYESASMDEIAHVAQFTKRTVYQYFTSKEDLLFAVALRLRQRMFARIQDALGEGGTGHERIHRAATAYHLFYNDFADVLRLVANSSHVRPKSDASPHYEELMRLGPAMFLEFAKAIAAGQVDGSIRADLDAKAGACSIAFVLTGFFNLLANSGPAFTGALGLDQGEFVRLTIDLIDDALRPGSAPASARKPIDREPPGKRKKP